MNENIQGNENNKDNSLKERTKSAVINKDNVKALKPSVEDEDDEILNALNHFFKSKKEEEKNRGKKK